MGTPNPVSGRFELNNTWLVRYPSPCTYMTDRAKKADGCKDYVEWAVSKGLAVVDINIPRYITDLDVSHHTIPTIKQLVMLTK